MIRVAILASGTGTNAIRLLQKAEELSNISIPLVIVDQSSSVLLEQIPKEFPKVKISLFETPLSGNSTERKQIHETKILAELQKFQIDWCFLAGYMRLLGPTLLNHFQDEPHTRMVNIHPSLLPAFPGLNGYEQAYESSAPVSGVTIHFVDSGLDTGAIIAQASFERGKEDTLVDFIQRGKELEWKLYPEVLNTLNREGTLRERR